MSRRLNATRLSQSSLKALEGIEEAPLLLTLGLLASALIREVYPHLDGPEERPLSPAEEYVRRSLLAVGGLLAVCEQMDFAVRSLSGFRRSRKPERRKITRLDYAYYHLENHLLRTPMLTERSLQFINVICALGLPEPECRVATVINNAHFKGKPIASAFHRLNEHIKPLRETRNILVHRSKVRDPSFESVESFFTLERLGSPDADRFAIVMKRKTDDILRGRKVELDQVNAQAFILIRVLLDAGEPIFKARHKSVAR